MNQPTASSSATLMRQILVVLKTYATRWEFWVAVAYANAFASVFSGTMKPRIAHPQTWTLSAYEVHPDFGPLESLIRVKDRSYDVDRAGQVEISPGDDFLSLKGSLITDETLASLARVSNIDRIKHLSCYRTSITDTGLEQLAALPNLQMIDIFGTQATGTGLQILKNHEKLISLRFQKSKVTREGIQTIAELQQLSSLEVSLTLLEEEAFQPLAAMKKLRYIGLEGTNISARAVGWLKELQNLRGVNVANTFISKDGVRQLRREISGIHVSGVKTLEKRMTDQQVYDYLAEQRWKHRSSYLFPLVLPPVILGSFLGMFIKLQFAAPRARMTPGFAKAHLLAAVVFIVATTTLPTLLVMTNAELSLVSVLAVMLFFLAWFTWMSYRNSMLMLFTLAGAGLWGFFVASADVQALLLDSFFADSINGPSLVLLAASGLALAALGLRVSRLHEEMPEYGLVFSFDMVWDLATRSANRRRQQLEANAISKSVVNAWLLDRQFNFVMGILPKSPLLRGVLMLELSHGLAAFLSIPILLAAVWLFGATFSSVKSSSSSHVLTSIAPVMMSAMLPMMALAIVNGQWLQHWRWFSGELVRPVTRSCYVRSIMTAISVDGLVALAVPLVMLIGAVSQGWSVQGLSGSQSAVLFTGHIFAHVATSLALIFWLASYRRIWPTVVALTISMIVHSGATAFSVSLRGNHLEVAVAAVVVVGGLLAMLFARLGWRRWTTLEFA